MKIAVSALGDTLEGSLDPRFGRAQYFIITDLGQADIDVTVINNAASLPAGGAGIATAQLLADNDVKAVITGNVGPNAMNVLKAAGFEIYKGTAATVGENIEKFKQGSLEKIVDTVSPHSGMGFGAGRGK